MIRRCPNGETCTSRLGGRRTQGTETSQYLEEEKTKVILRVVASESGLAQTVSIRTCGVVGLPISYITEMERFWKGRPKEVKVLYV